MTPRQVDELTPEEYGAMIDYIDEERREQERLNRKAERAARKRR